jgi:hypothetical protein
MDKPFRRYNSGVGFEQLGETSVNVKPFVPLCVKANGYTLARCQQTTPESDLRSFPEFGEGPECEEMTYSGDTTPVWDLSTWGQLLSVPDHLRHCV